MTITLPCVTTLLLGADGALLAALLQISGRLLSWLFQLFLALRLRKPYFATAYCAASVKAANAYYDYFVRVRELFQCLKTQESSRICSKKTSQEGLCYAASETQLKGKASRQSCIRGRNRQRLFGVIDHRIGGGYTAAKYGAVSGPEPG